MNSSHKAKKALHRILLCGIGYSVYFLSYGLYMIFSPFLLLLSFSPELMYKTARTVNRSFLFFLTRIFLPGLHIYKIAEKPSFQGIKDDSPKIFVANHRSRLDGPIIIPFLKKTGVVIKTSYARLPVFSSFVKHLDYVSVSSDSVATMATAINKCKEMFRSGSSILIFPEGTRSRSARLMSFKDLAFRLSIETGYPVIPVVVHSECPFMAKIPGSLVPPFRMKFTIRDLPPMFPEKDERASHFADRVRKRMMEEIRILDKGTVWDPDPKNTEEVQ